MIAQLICVTLGLILFGFGLVIGLYPEGDQTVGILIMFGGLAQIIYSIGVVNE
jgi:flagellar basal body P-ring protein FlgI